MTDREPAMLARSHRDSLARDGYAMLSGLFDSNCAAHRTHPRQRVTDRRHRASQQQDASPSKSFEHSHNDGWHGWRRSMILRLLVVSGEHRHAVPCRMHVVR